MYTSSSTLSVVSFLLIIIFIGFSFVICHPMHRYTYKVCPFKKASQAEGHSSTDLGYVCWTDSRFPKLS
jgi:hypothetical protein